MRSDELIHPVISSQGYLIYKITNVYKQLKWLHGKTRFKDVSLDWIVTLRKYTAIICKCEQVDSMN